MTLDRTSRQLSMAITIHDLNQASRSRALEMTAPLAERSPWVAEAALNARPFASDEARAEALVEVILATDAAKRIDLFQVHPELAGIEGPEGRMSEESTGEQDRLGLTRLRGPESRRLAAPNAAYRLRFGYPFILAPHRIPDRASNVAIFELRRKASPVEEHTTTIAEIAPVIRNRAVKAFGNATVSSNQLESEPQE